MSDRAEPLVPGRGRTEDDRSLNVDIEDLDTMELRILAEHVYEMLRRELLFERERLGYDHGRGRWPH